MCENSRSFSHSNTSNVWRTIGFECSLELTKTGIQDTSIQTVGQAKPNGSFTSHYVSPTSSYPLSHLSPPTRMPCSHLKGPGLCGLVLTSLATYSSVYREHHNYNVGVLIHIEKFQLYSSHIKHSHSKHSAF